MSPAFADFFAQIAILIPAFLVALSFHEFFHAFIAYLCGDDTAKQQGRMTINPLAHVDFFGLICLILFKIGWAKPVPFDNRNFKYPKLYSVLTALAGPFANFLMALGLFYAIHYFPAHLFTPAIALTFLQIFEATAYVNIMLGVFNLLPIPPLDGSHVITMLLVDKFPNFVLWLHRYSFILLLFLIFFPPTRDFLVKLILISEIVLRSLVF
ncbi:MAG: site-2 protease family protein [Candidatus Babeliales bacterium]|jgi:Zn-dependent protease